MWIEYPACSLMKLAAPSFCSHLIGVLRSSLAHFPFLFLSQPGNLRIVRRSCLKVTQLLHGLNRINSAVQMGKLTSWKLKDLIQLLEKASHLWDCQEPQWSCWEETEVRPFWSHKDGALCEDSYNRSPRVHVHCPHLGHEVAPSELEHGRQPFICHLMSHGCPSATEQGWELGVCPITDRSGNCYW